MMRQSPSPYMPQEAPPDVPALTKMVNMQGSDDTMIKTEVPDVPNLIQADANSNYQHQQAAHHQQAASPSPQSQNQGQSGQEDNNENSDTSIADDVKGFLDKHKLSMYFEYFVEHGYDDIGDIINMSDPRLEMLMNLTGIAKKDGHKGRFLSAIHFVRTMKLNWEQARLAQQQLQQQHQQVQQHHHQQQQQHHQQQQQQQQHQQPSLEQFNHNKWPPPPHPLHAGVPHPLHAGMTPPLQQTTPTPPPPYHPQQQHPLQPTPPTPPTPPLPPGDYKQMLMIPNPLRDVVKTEEIEEDEGEEDDDHVKRPMNAFMVWSRTERRKLALKYPNMLNCEISKLLGAEWSRMNEEEKSPYVQESKRLRTIHSQKYPDYSYKPRRRKRKVTQSQSVYPSINFPPGNNSMPPYQFPPSAYPKMPSDAFKMPGFGSDNSYQVPLQDPNKALNYLNNAAMGLPTDMKSYYNLTPPTSNLFPPSTSNYSSLTFSGNSQNNMYSSASNYMPSLFKDHQF